MKIPHPTYILCFAVLLAGILLQGCAGHPAAVQVQKVEVPVAVSCHAEDVPVPVWSVDGLPGTATYSQRVQAVFEDMDKAKAYIGELEAQLSGCK